MSHKAKEISLFLYLTQRIQGQKKNKDVVLMGQNLIEWKVS